MAFEGGEKSMTQRIIEKVFTKNALCFTFHFQKNLIQKN